MRTKIRSHHGDRVKYVAYVLWLIGYPERAIALALSLRTKQVAGIIHRSEYSGRSHMTDQERKEKLKELEEIRLDQGEPIDDGMLDRVPFSILPIGATGKPGPLRRRM
ncbi:hypothetical protein Rleg9DRAFT_1733 [Rhizobium leguminosarum bv. trifolii WSM597]|uniref:Uncharacterized protein n=1 Tax=Rhizobium leguminosarum bv. trifolii WSM597 TaxID=754764 RepID=J0GZ96_RHILT|nr:hypothetical protein [Rhizobium leguminosarum]EJB02918.1 hypothetical protein Rleg9DRAFT_1733 [Rhizobium leguminosarum bv. trifolii WSM597]